MEILAVFHCMALAGVAVSELLDWRALKNVFHCMALAADFDWKVRWDIAGLETSRAQKNKKSHSKGNS